MEQIPQTAESISKLKSLQEECYEVVANKNGTVPEELTMEKLPEAIASIHDILEELTITQNGEYTPREGVDGFSKVSVNVSPYDSLKIKIEETDVVPLIRLMSDTSISSKVTSISDNTTGWTYTFPTTSSAGPVYNGINMFKDVESITLGCKTISGTTVSGGDNWSIFKLPNIKKLDLSYLENITFGTYLPAYWHIFNNLQLEELKMPKLKTYVGILFRSCKLPEEVVLPSLTNCGTGIFESCKGVKRLIVENVTTCPGYSYFPNFVANCPDLEYIYAPKLSNLNTYGTSNGANTLQNCKNLKELVIHNAPFTFTQSPRRYYLRNCPKLEILDLRGSITKTLYLDNYKPSTVIEENLQLFLYNFKTYIADRLPDRSSTTSLSLILSPLVYDTLQESGQTIINLISDKNWTLVKSSLEEIV